MYNKLWMSNSLGDILGKKDFSEPSEIQTIKSFVSDKFGQMPNVKLAETTIIITVSSASLAGALRPELHKLQAQLETKKRLIIRID